MKKYLAAVAAFVCVPGVAAAQDAAPTAPAAQFDGVRFEARLGYETPTVSEDGDVYKIGSAVSFGGEAGFDLRVGNSVVMGPYATYEFSSVDLCDGGDCLSEDGNLGAGVRVGVVAGRTLIYGKLGYARIRFTASSGTFTGSESESGVQGAIGVNVNFGRNVYGLAEINYADYGSFAGINLQRRHVAAGVGFRF
jgi:outer membrane immunogenic protein